MIFNITEELVMQGVAQGLEDAIMQVSEEKFYRVYELVEKALPDVVGVIAEGVAENWKETARKNSPGWGGKYARTIKTKQTGNTAEVYVDESMKDKNSGKDSLMFVKMVEEGMNSFNIRDALMKSEKAKIGPDGLKYIIVPFPVATPRKENQGTMQNKFGKREMTAEMYKIVKSGGRLTSGSLSVRGRDVDVAGLSQYTTPKLHSQYGIFRRVKENSPGWIHPGQGPTPVFPSVVQETHKQIQAVLSEFCRNIVKELSD